MKLSDILASDLSAILADFEQVITVKHDGVTVRVNAGVDAVNTADAGYLAIEGEAVNCTATIARKSLPFTPAIGDAVTIDGYRYAITGISSTPGDSAIVLSLAVEGRNA